MHHTCFSYVNAHVLLLQVKTLHLIKATNCNISHTRLITQETIGHPNATVFTTDASSVDTTLKAASVRLTWHWCVSARTGCGSCWCSQPGQTLGPGASGWSQLSSPWRCELAAGTAAVAPGGGTGALTGQTSEAHNVSIDNLKGYAVFYNGMERDLANHNQG